MKTLNFWRTLFCSVLAVAAFAACSDDDDKGFSGEPTITVNGTSTTTVATDLDGGDTEAVEVVSSGRWTLTFQTSGADAWCTPSAMSGDGGTTMLKFNLAKSTVEREATILLTTWGKIAGYEIKQEATIVVKQNEGGSTEADTNVAEIRALLKAMNPGDSKAPVTDQIAAMKITGVVVSDYNGHNFGNDYNIAIQDAKAGPNAGLTLNANKFAELKLTPGMVVTAPLKGAQVNLFAGVLQIAISNDVTIATNDGTAPAPMVITPEQIFDYESQFVKIENAMPAEGVAETTWADSYNADFITTAGESFTVYSGKQAAYREQTIPDKSGYVQGIASRSNAFKRVQPRNADDLKGLDQPMPTPDYTVATIAQITKAGNYEVKNATVIATHTQGILVNDETGIMLAFIGAAPEVAVNDVVTVKGTTEMRYGVIQFGKGNLTITKTGTGSFTPPAPEVMDGAAVNAYIATAMDNKAEYKYVKYLGEFVVSDNYYNVNIAGTTTKGSVAYGKPEWAAFNGKQVAVEGWLLGGSANYLQTMATSVTEDTTTPVVTISAPAVFAAAAPAAQTLTYTVANVAASDVTFAIEGTDAAKFSLGTKTDNSIVVNAIGDNTTDAAYTAQLVAKVAGATLATVDLRQDGVSSGEDTKGIYTWMNGLLPATDDSKVNYYYSSSTVAANGSDPVKMLRLGKSKFAGAYTTPALGLTGDKKLSFYAVSWKGSDATVYVRVNGGGNVTGSPVTALSNEGYSGSGNAFKMTLTDSDYFTFQLTGLTAESTITISTSENFEGEANAANKGRVAIIGLQVY